MSFGSIESIYLPPEEKSNNKNKPGEWENINEEEFEEGVKSCSSLVDIFNHINIELKDDGNGNGGKPIVVNDISVFVNDTSVCINETSVCKTPKKQKSKFKRFTRWIRKKFRI